MKGCAISLSGLVNGHNHNFVHNSVIIDCMAIPFLYMFLSLFSFFLCDRRQSLFAVLSHVVKSGYCRCHMRSEAYAVVPLELRKRGVRNF